MASVDVNIGKAVRGMTLQARITGLPMLRVRLRLGTRLIRLAALVIGCDIDVQLVNRSGTASES